MLTPTAPCRRRWPQLRGGGARPLLPLLLALALLLLLSKPSGTRGFLLRRPTAAPPSRPRGTAVAAASSSSSSSPSGDGHAQPPARTLPLPGPPGEWEGLPPERHAEFLREVRNLFGGMHDPVSQSVHSIMEEITAQSTLSYTHLSTSSGSAARCSSARPSIPPWRWWAPRSCWAWRATTGWPRG